MQEKSTFERLREDERETRKQLITEAAINLFNDKSFNEIGMREIAAEAGVSPASLYRYFPSRDDLLVEALIHEIIAGLKGFEARMASKPFSLEEFSRYVVDYLTDHEATFQMMSYMMIKGEMTVDALEKFNRSQKTFLDQFDMVLKPFCGDCAALRFFSQAFFAALAGVVMTYRNYPGRTKKERRAHMNRMAAIIGSMFRCGMAAVIQEGIP
jgi:AcrR family transcriptional regulator